MSDNEKFTIRCLADTLNALSDTTREYLRGMPTGRRRPEAGTEVCAFKAHL